MSDAERRALTVLRERVLHGLFALHTLLHRMMRPTIPGQRAIVRVGGDGFY